MISEDYYTGEPNIIGSSTNFLNNQDMVISTADDVEAANMASFARSKYDFDPGVRSPLQPQNAIYPGYNGYNSYYRPPGIGMQPYGYSPYGNIQPTYGMYQQPAGYAYGYGAYYNNYQQQPQPQQPQYIHINGVSNNGEYLPPIDYQEQIEKIQMEFWIAQQELEAKNSVDRQFSNNVYGGYNPYGFNYYGSPYFANSYQYNSLNNELAQRIQTMKDKARENRLAFDLKIARLAHNFAGLEISEDALLERYTGKDIEVPSGLIPSVQEYQEQARFANMVPFDNSQMYRDFHARVSAEFNAVVSPDGNLKETFANMGVINAQWEMEEEMHRRKNGGGLYNSGDNSYKYFVRKKAQERYAMEKGIILPDSTGSSINMSMYENRYNSIDTKQMTKDFISTLPTLKGATLADDGTLTLPCPFGSHAGQTYSVHNSQESEYDAKRERFGAFLDSVPGNIYLDTQKQKKYEDYKDG